MTLAQVTFRDGRFVLLVRQESGAIHEAEMDRNAVDLLMFTASQALAGAKADPTGDPLLQPLMVDAEAQGVITGNDDRGHAFLTVQGAAIPPMRFRFDDNLARQVVDGFRELLDTPMDVRLSMRAN